MTGRCLFHSSSLFLRRVFRDLVFRGGGSELDLRERAFSSPCSLEESLCSLATYIYTVDVILSYLILNPSL